MREIKLYDNSQLELIDLKSQNFHNRTVSDLRKMRLKTNLCLKGRTK